MTVLADNNFTQTVGTVDNNTYELTVGVVGTSDVTEKKCHLTETVTGNTTMTHNRNFTHVVG